MPITTVILAGALVIVSDAPVQLTVDFSRVTTGIDYRIDIKLFDKKCQQKGKIQPIIIGDAASIDDIMSRFTTAMSNIGLTATVVKGTEQMLITGPISRFGSIKYNTSTQNGDDWIQNNKLKGPTLVGKVDMPNFYVNGTKLGP